MEGGRKQDGRSGRENDREGRETNAEGNEVSQKNSRIHSGLADVVESGPSREGNSNDVKGKEVDLPTPTPSNSNLDGGAPGGT